MASVANRATKPQVLGSSVEPSVPEPELAGARPYVTCLVVSLLVLANLNCSKSPSPPPQRIPLLETERRALVAASERQLRAVRRYQAFLGIRGRGPEGGFDAKLVALFDDRDRMRVELVGPLGGTRWAALFDAEGVLVVFPGRREYLRETDQRAVIAQLLGMALGRLEVQAILRGNGLPIMLRGEPSGAYRMGERRYLEFGPEANATKAERIAFDADGQIVEAIAPQYRIEYPRSWLATNRQVPRRIRLSSDAVRASLSVEDLEVNTELHPEAFVLDVPPEYDRLELAQIGSEAVFVRSPHPERK